MKIGKFCHDKYEKNIIQIDSNHRYSFHHNYHDDHHRYNSDHHDDHHCYNSDHQHYNHEHPGLTQQLVGGEDAVQAFMR